MTEKAFMQQVIDLAHLYHWKTYHTFDSRRSAAGFPDLTMVHPIKGQFLLAELKTDKGKLTAEQRSWYAALCMANIECHIWRPGDFDTIVARLAVQS